MNYYGNSARMRGGLLRQNAPANPIKSTFAKNLKTPSFQRRFISPEPKCNANYGMTTNMRTPMLIENTGYFEVPREPSTESFLPVVETDKINEDYGFGDFEEYEYEPTMRNGNNFKRKNPYQYSKNEPMDFQSNRKLYPAVAKCTQNSSATMIEPKTPNNRFRQTILCSDTPTGLGFKSSPKETPKLTINIPLQWSPSDSLLPFKGKQDKNNNQTYPRIFTVSIEKLLSWPKALSCRKIIFELFGILEKTWDVKQPKAKKIQLKSQRSATRTTCTFYEIDRQLPLLKPGQWLRCIVLIRCNDEIQCLSIRPASANELKYLDKLMIDSSKMMAKVLLMK